MINPETITLGQNITQFTGRHNDDILFFDIETTGFMVNRTQIYLIGCIYYQDENWIFTQYFAQNSDEEIEALHSFFSLVSQKKCLICYNGTGFDIPYIQKKCQEHSLDYSFDNIDILDIYKQILPFQKIFKTENLKQKTMEKYIGLFREDKFDGGELIKVFHEYKKNQDEKMLNLLLLHNKEDLLGMTEIISLLAYPALTFEDDYSNCSFSLTDNNELKICINLCAPVPHKIMTGKDNIFLSVENNSIILLIKLSLTELKYFYPNYKDYFYLPAEDYAIHKSIAQFVDKNLRIKAKADNCYIKKTGLFIPQFEELASPAFKYNVKDSTSYFEYSDDLIIDSDFTKKYVRHIITYLLKND